MVVAAGAVITGAHMMMGDAVVTVDLGVGMLIGDTMTQAFRGTAVALPAGIVETQGHVIRLEMGAMEGHELVEGQCHGGGMTRGDQQLLMGSPL
mmetsp:Transcript_3502/g.8722  ORF Transcript_3502/g.8722 Transcript_3502/m.8722 type:complete len:94 (-) Transcript_3502:16-297(-)